MKIFNPQLTQWASGCHAALNGNLAFELPANASGIYRAGHDYAIREIVEPALDEDRDVKLGYIIVPWAPRHSKMIATMMEHSNSTRLEIVTAVVMTLAKK